MLAVVDTNVLVSALLRPASPPGAVLQGIGQLRLTPVACAAIIAEYAGVLGRTRFGFDPADIRELLALIEQLAVWVEVPSYTGTPKLPDPADWPFIACALAAGCPVITGNTRDFPAELGVKVMTAREWVDRHTLSLDPPSR